jgi:hypothetical protein
MPRLSLYRPQKGNDYRFIDKTIWEMFQIGGTDVFLHKYIGAGSVDFYDSSTAYKTGDLVQINKSVYKATANSSGVVPPNSNFWEYIRSETPSQPIYSEDNPFQIQDLLFLENRDRKYDPDVYLLRGVYNVQDTDFNLSQFGLFLQNDTIFITFHINDSVEKIGRKLISGDVIELPHLKDEFALNDLQYALKRFYVIEEVTRAAEGFSVTWYPHLYRAKCKPLVDSQEFKDILDGIANADNYQGNYNSEITYYPGDVVTGPDGKNYNVIAEVTGVAPPDSQYYELAESLRDIMSTYEREMQITKAVLDQAEADAPKSGYDTSKFYTIQKDASGKVELVTAANMILDASVQTQATDENGNPLVDENGDPVYVGSTASQVFRNPEYEDYDGYLLGDGVPPNGAPFTAGIAFPLQPVDGQYCLRTDYLPKRLFRYNGTRWIKMEDVVRMTMSNLGASDVGTGDVFEGKEVRQTQKTTFINNDKVSNINGKSVKEKQSLSKALRPQADE